METMSVRTRSGKKEETQNPQIMIPRRKSTLTIGRFEDAVMK
jgi:hypothetical protein